MKIDRRNLLTGGALLGLAGALAPSQSAAASGNPATKTAAALKRIAVYVPGYMPEYAFANGKPLDRNRRFTRSIRQTDGIKRMITRVGMDGSIRQTLLPVNAHDIEVAPDRSIGVLCGFEGAEHCSFDPETLEMAGIAPSFREGWRGGGHAAYLDGGRTVIISERSPKQQAKGGLEHLYGRLTIRDPQTLQDPRKLFHLWRRPPRHQADRKRQIHRGRQLRLDHFAGDRRAHGAAHRRGGVDHGDRGFKRQTGGQEEDGPGPNRTAPPGGRKPRPHLRHPVDLWQCARGRTPARRGRDRL